MSRLAWTRAPPFIIRFLPTDFLPTGFLVTDFLPTGFLVTDFLPTDFLPTDFLPTGFLPTGFLVTGFLPLSLLYTFSETVSYTQLLLPPLYSVYTLLVDVT